MDFQAARKKAERNWERVKFLTPLRWLELRKSEAPPCKYECP